MENIIKSPHSLKYENGHVNVSGVVNLDSFESEIIIARLIDKSMVIKGTKLNVEDLNIKSGLMVISGEISGITYHRKIEKLSFVKRFFK